MRISDWSSDVCSSDLVKILKQFHLRFEHRVEGRTQEAAERHLLLGQAADPKIYLIDAGRRGRSVQKGHALGVERVRSGARQGGIAEHKQRRGVAPLRKIVRSEEHTSELQSLMRISYAVFCLKKKK